MTLFLLLKFITMETSSSELFGNEPKLRVLIIENIKLKIGAPLVINSVNLV